MRLSMLYIDRKKDIRYWIGRKKFYAPAKFFFRCEKSEDVNRMLLYGVFISDKTSYHF